MTGSWGVLGFGAAPFGGSLSGGMGGGHIPAALPWDIYWVQSGAQMAVFDSYIEVLVYADGDQVGNDVTTGDFQLQSGGVVETTTARFVVNMPVPDVFTFEMTVLLQSIPVDFTNLPAEHVFFSVTAEANNTFGFFLSEVGIAYTNSGFYDSLGTYHINGPVQLLPDSFGLITTGEYLTFRAVMNGSSLYLYVTKTADLPTTGPQLKFILPSLPTSGSVINPGDLTVVSVAGTPSSPSFIQVSSIALGHGLITPNLPPIADAGRDQAIRTCSIVRFDGRGSFDPQGLTLTYFWRLISAPDTSMYTFLVHDGRTIIGPLTNKVYSPALAAIAAAPGIVAGDVLNVLNTPYNITTTGSDINGFYVQIDGFDIPAPQTNMDVRLLKQNALSNKTSTQPTFYPDVLGLFKFDLIVNDGSSQSLPSTTIVNVVDTPIPRGIQPDVSFLWSTISDFWKMVDGKEIITTFWEAVAQVTATELLTLWQYDYNKSLRDIQRTFQRRWLHYDLYIGEPLPDQTFVDTLYGGIESIDLTAASLSAANMMGSFVVSSPLFPDTTITVQPNTDPMDPSVLFLQLAQQLQRIDLRFSLNLYQNTAATADRIMITAPFPFSISSISQAGPLFPVTSNGLPNGTGGSVVGANTYLVGRRLDMVFIKDGDYLVVDGKAFQISRVVTVATDPWGSQRIVTYDTLPMTLSGNWTVARGVTSVFLDFYNSLCSSGDTAVFEVVNNVAQTVGFTEVNVLSAASDRSTSLLADTGDLGQFLSQPTVYSVYFYGIYRRTYMPIDPLVVEVPTLQELIVNTDDTAVLRQNVDYFVETYRGSSCLRFVASKDLMQPDVWMHGDPPARMWAETTFVDNRPNIEGNFGLVAGFSLDDFAQLPNHPDYLSAVQGLWYLYFRGPTMQNLRTGTQILLGLPYAEQTGKIVELRTDFSSTTGRILVQDADNTEIVRSYTFPVVLPVETNPATGKSYVVGDTVQQFAPMVRGVEVVDYIKDPKWYQGYLNQGVFYEIEKFFKFLVRIDSKAFSLDTLLFVQSFIYKIKPAATTPVFVVQKKLDSTTVDVLDTIQKTGNLWINEWIGSFQIDLGPTGFTGGAFDVARSGGGGVRGRYDGDDYLGGGSPGNAATYPNPVSPIHWGYDREMLVPDDIIYGIISTVVVAPTDPIFDGIYAWDLPLMDTIYGVFGVTILALPAVPPHTVEVHLGPPQTVTTTTTIDAAVLEYRSVYPTSIPLTMSFGIYVNGTLAQTIPFTIPAGSSSFIHPLPASLTLPGGTPTLEVRVSSSSVDVPLPGGAQIFVTLGHGSLWAYDTPVAGSTYKKARMF